MAIDFLNSLTSSGSITIGSLLNASADSDKFLTVNGNGRIDYVTGSQLRGYIDAGTMSSWRLTGDSGTSASVIQNSLVTIQGGTGMSTSSNGFIVDLTNTDRGSQQSIFKNFTADSGGTATANSNNDTIDIAGGSNVTTVRSGDTITINATQSGEGVTSVSQTHGGNAFTVGGSPITSSGTLAITMAGSSAQYINGAGNLTTFPSIPQGDITAVVAGSGISGGGTSGSVTITNSDKGSSQAIFKNVAVSGQNTVIADSNNDTLTFVATGGMSITTNNTTDTITFNPNDNNDNYYVTGGNVTSGTVTLNRQGLGNVTFAINTSQITNGAGYTTNVGTTTASNSQTFTNKSGNISQWSNDSGYITSGSLPTVNNATITFTAGTNLTGGGVITLNQASNETVTFNNSITNNNQLTNGAGYTNNTGTVTSVALSAQGDALQITGTPVSGSGTLVINFQGDTEDYINGEGDIVAFPSIPQGDITAVVAGNKLTGGGTSGSVTLGLASNNISQWSNNSGYTTNTGTTTASNAQTFTNKGGNISQWTNDSGYTTSVGDITAVVAGTGLSGGGTSGSVTLNNTITNNNQLTNGAGYTTNVGDITAVSAGSGMSGGGTSGAVTLTNADKGSSQAIYKNFAVSGQNTVVADSNNDTMTFVATGGMSITTNNATDTITFNPNDNNDNYYVTGASQSGGTLTLTRQGLSTLTATGFTNASNSQTFTNKGGNISQWTNNSGYITAGSLPTVNNATITLTAGTGLSGGGTITLNQASNETVTFNNSITNNNQLTNGAGYTTNTGTTTASNSQTFTNKGGNISQWTNDSGYVTSSGGSMSSWTLKEGNGTETSNVTNGETVTFAQGAGIQTELTSTSSGGTLTISNTITNNNQLTNGAGYTTSVGDITGVTAGTGMSGGGTSGTVTLNCTVPVITNNNQLTNGAGYVTSEGSNNFVTGGNVTSGTLTLNRSGLSNVSFAINNVQIANGAGYTTNTGTTTASNTQTFTNKGGNISQWTNNSGYTTNVGDITGVTAGTGMSGGGTSGTVTLNCTVPVISNNNQLSNGAGYVTSSGGSMSSWKITADSGGTAVVDNAETVDIAGGTNITTSRSANTVTITNGISNNNQLTNGAGYTTSVGDITGVTAGTNMSGGGTSGTVTLNCTITNNNQLSNGAGYVTSSGNTTIGTSTNIGISAGAAVLSTVALTQGVITAFTTRTLTLANLGYTGATNANNITNNNQLTNGAGYTTNTGTVTGSGSNNRIALWSGSSSLDSSSGLSTNSSGNSLVFSGLYEMALDSSGDFFELNSGQEDVGTKIVGFAGDGTLTIGEGAISADGAHFYVASGHGLSVGTSAAASNTIRCTGNIIAYYSDERLKDFKGAIPNALDKVCQIGGYYYEQNEKAAELGYENYERQVGVNAQEIQKIMPEVVEIAPISYNEEADGVEYLTVDYAKLVPLLIESIKELKAEVDLLKNK